jgi:hypothetical protein
MQWFKNLFRRPAVAPKSPRRAPRPGLERLDDRLVPSVTASSAVTTGTTHTLFVIDQATQQVTGYATVSGYNAIAGKRAFGGPQVSEVSASIDPRTGQAEVYALGRDHSLWRMDSNAVWHSLGGSYKGISATRDGQVFAVTSDGSDVRLFNQADQPTDLGAPGGYVSDIAAGRDAYFGQDEVFALGPDNGVYVWNGDFVFGPYRAWREIDAGSFQTLSATQNGVVFALDANGNLFQETESPYWISGVEYFFWSRANISGGYAYKQISADVGANGYAEVYGLRLDNSLALYNQGSWRVKDYSVQEVSAADGGYFFDVNYYGGSTDYVYAYDPQLSSPWVYLGPAWIK